jgi:hypothetical protein
VAQSAWLDEREKAQIRAGNAQAFFGIGAAAQAPVPAF